MLKREVNNMGKILDDFTKKECYERIYKWHKKNGVKGIEEYGGPDRYKRDYLLFLENLMPPNEVTEEKMKSVFGEIRNGIMEWSFQKEDDYGIKMSEYALFAQNK
jgi:hypothetical protein